MKEKKSFEKPEMKALQLKTTGMLSGSTCSVNCGLCSMNN